MRIAVLCDALYPYGQGGRETLHYERSKRLARRGHAVRIHTLHWWPEPQTEIVRDGIVISAITRRRSTYTAKGRRSRWHVLLFSVLSLRLLWSPAFDVLDVDQFPFLHILSARLVCRLRRRPMTVTWHEVWSADTWRRRAGFVGPIGFALQRFAARQADLIFANSALTATRLTGWLGVDPRRIVILPPSGVESIGEREALPKRFDCIFIGRLLPHTNVDLLLEALASLPGVSALIVGSGPDLSRLESLAAGLDLAGRVSFESPGTREAVLARLRAARLLTFPSTREGFGSAVLEANACGVPALIIRHVDNAAAEIVRDGENGLVCGLDAVEIAAAVRKFLDDPQTEARMGEAARSVASAYSWETYVTRMIGSLRAVARNEVREAA